MAYLKKVIQSIEHLFKAGFLCDDAKGVFSNLLLLLSPFIASI